MRVLDEAKKSINVEFSTKLISVAFSTKLCLTVKFK
jgi:hypothetical protein